jgi:hypothetical protein
MKASRLRRHYGSVSDLMNFTRIPAIVSLLVVAALPVRGADAAPAVEKRIIGTAATVAIQREAEDPKTGRYDWGPCVVYDDGLYRMWWVRLGGKGQGKRFPYKATLPDGEVFEFTYPDWGDRIYYAESRDGRTWNIGGDDYAGPPEKYSPDVKGPMLVLGPAENAEQRNHLAAPCVIKVDGTWYCYTEACSEFVVYRGPGGRIMVGNEYQNQVFLAMSKDGRSWHQYPDNRDPQPIVPAPPANKNPGRQRYGFGQPSVFYQKNQFVMHYVDSCTGPGDFVVRIEADNPYFRNARPAKRCLVAPAGTPAFPAGAVARFAQTDVRYLGDEFLLVRSAYETGNVNLLTSTDGVFRRDLQAVHPRDVFPQVVLKDDRGPDYRDRLFPRFLTDPSGRVRVENGKLLVYYGSGKGGKPACWNWDLRLAEIPLAAIW